MSINNRTTLPNISAVLASPGADTGGRGIIAAARSNPELAAALATLEDWTLTAKRIEDLRVVGEEWTTAAREAIAGADAKVALLSALDDGTTSKLPARLAKDRQQADHLVAALSTAADVARDLVSHQSGLVRDRGDDLLAELGARLQAVVAEHESHREALTGITTAEDAIDAGAAEAWQGAATARQRAHLIVAAQQAILRGLTGELASAFREDPRLRLALAEVEDWRVIEPRLPQIIRHNGIWSVDVSTRRNPAALVEPMHVPWPADLPGRTDWLLDHHPDQMRVPSMQEMRAERENLNELVRRCTPTGGEAEPHRLLGADSINQRVAR